MIYQIVIHIFFSSRSGLQQRGIIGPVDSMHRKIKKRLNNRTTSFESGSAEIGPLLRNIYKNVDDFPLEGCSGLASPETLSSNGCHSMQKEALILAGSCQFQADC